MARRPKTNAQWTAETTAKLVRVARREFAKHGYADASVDTIAAELGLTKGAVYYHYENKQALFEAALRDVQADVVTRIDAASSKDAVEAVKRGCDAFLAIALDDEMRRVVLTDGPSVLGWSKWRAIDAEFGLGTLIEGLQACKDEGRLQGADVNTVAHLISGALNEAVFLIADAVDRGQSHQRAKRNVQWLLDAVLR
ncbi:MAG: TetR/AcrR family transcriptional regulator [Archangium sp.]